MDVKKRPIARLPSLLRLSCRLIKRVSGVAPEILKIICVCAMHTCSWR
jgi:hypothetical protein